MHGRECVCVICIVCRGHNDIERIGDVEFFEVTKNSGTPVPRMKISTVTV